MTRRELLSTVVLAVRAESWRAVPSATTNSEEACNGQVIASGRLSSADHEMADGWFAVSECGIHVHPDGIPAQILRGFRDQPVEIVVRKIEKVER